MLKKFLTKSIFTCISLTVALSLNGCGQIGQKSTNEKIEDFLTNTTSYESVGNLTRISNKGESNYKIQQWFDSSGKYKMEILSPENIAGNYTIFDGNKVYQFNPKVNSGVAVEANEDEGRNQLFLGEFIENYNNGGSLLEENDLIVLETTIPGNYDYTATEKLWLTIDDEFVTPNKLIIYDSEGKERYILQYEDFLINATIAPETFTIPQ